MDDARRRAVIVASGAKGARDGRVSAKTLEEWQALAAKELGGKSAETLARETLEGIAVKPLYTEARSRRARARRGDAGLPALSARGAGDDVREPPVDDPPICRLLDRRGFEPLLSREP